MDTSSSSSEGESFRDRLPKEIEAWQREGLVRPEQGQALLARYDLLPGETPRTLRRSRIVNVVAVLGVILVGVGVILLVGANWQDLPKWMRLALLIGATGGCYVGGYRMAFQSRTYPKVGMALLLLGSLLWGASIFLVGQMYHMGGTGVGEGERKAVLYWFLGVLPLGYILLSSLHLGLALVIGSVWLGMAAVDLVGGLPPHAYAVLALAPGIALYGMGRLHRWHRSIGGLELPYRALGLVSVFAALYAFSFRVLWVESLREMSYGWRAAEAGEQQALLLGLLLAPGLAAVVGMLVARPADDRAATYEALGLASLVVIALVVIMTVTDVTLLGALVGWSGESVYADGGGYTLMGVFNLLLLAGAVGVIALGWVRNEPGMANFGLFVFFVQVVTRYFDLIGTMLSSGLMFIGAGVLLLLGGWALEHSRRRLLSAMTVRRAG